MIEGVNGIEIRLATDEDLPAVARLRWHWVLEENGGSAVVSHDEFVSGFVRWARRNAASHRCFVLLRDGDVVAMAWLACVPRVPTPGSPERTSGDVPCVYVVPEERDGGLGGRLLDAVLAHASEQGVERVTVHSSARAIPAYVRHGFESSSRLLHVRPPVRGR